MIRYFVVDLDGTFIHHDDTLPKEHIALIEQLKKDGIGLIFATGRSTNMVKDILDHYDLNIELILNNGTQFTDRYQTFNEIHPMNNDAFKYIAQTLHDAGYHLAIHTNQGLYSLLDPDTFWDYHMKLVSVDKRLEDLPKKTFTTRELYYRNFHYAHSVDDIVDAGVEVLKIDARHLDHQGVAGIKQFLNTDHLTITSSFEANMEITTDEITKGMMLQKVLRDKGLKDDEIAVFGDGGNDVEMLSMFPYSFAVANARDIAKEAAHYTLSKTVDEGGVAEAYDILKSMQLI